MSKMRDQPQGIKGLVRAADPLLLLLVALAAVYFAYMYAIDGTRPGNLAPLGWFGYWDQSQYLVLAQDLSDFTLSAERFQYGVGYPIVAVPFLWLGLDYDPFAVFDGLAFVFVAAGTFVLGSRLFSRTVGAVAGFGLVFATGLIGFVVTPWNSTVSLVALVAILLVATAPKRRPWHAPVMGAMVGWGFAARYIDLLWLGLITVVVLLAADQRLRHCLVAGAAALAVTVPVLVLHDVAFGSPLETPYAQHFSQDGTESDQDASSYHLGKIPEAAFGVFVSPFLREGQVGTPLLAIMFWTILALPGAFIALRKRSWRYRPVVGAAISGWMLATLFYLSFRGFGGGTLQFGALHYIKMWWPVACILAAAFIVWVAQRRSPDRLPSERI